MPNQSVSRATVALRQFVRVVVGFALGGSLLAQGTGRLPARQNEVTSGQTKTLLSDGRLLVVGGIGPDGAQGTLAIIDAASGASTPLAVTLRHPRTGHSATTLADGRVLIFGGIDSRGRLVPVAELFDPDTNDVTSMSTPLPARTGHSATLLTDGRVLIVGGRGGTADTSPAYVWSPVSEKVESVGTGAVSRVGHRATLLGDGAVLFEGGTDSNGKPLQSEMYFPEQSIFVSVPGFKDAVLDPVFAGSTPIDGAADVPVGQTIAVRFSGPVVLAPSGSDAFALASSDGTVATHVVVAEGGRLVFVHPLHALESGRQYSLKIGPVATVDRDTLPIATISFTTEVPAERNPRPHEDADEPDLAKGDAPSSWQKLPPLQAAPGITALAGQTLRLNGLPLQGVHISLAGVRTRTDDTGRFLLPDVPAGRQELVVDSRPVSTRRRMYGIFMIAVDVEAGGTTALPFTIWLPTLDTRNEIRLPAHSRGDFVARTPRFPGLEVHIPAGGRLRDVDGKVAKSMTITPIPIDRAPFPLPKGLGVSIYFTLQPGGARLEGNAAVMARGIRLIFPNTSNLKPGTRVDFLSYDSKQLGWFLAGQGTVARNGKTIIPDPGVVIRHFTCARLGNPSTAPGTGPAPGGGPREGDPVDLGTGLFVYEKLDALLPDVLPIAFSRTYRQNDPTSRPFGRGATHSYELHLVGDKVSYSYAELVLADGGRIRFDRTSPGTSHTDAVMEATSTPTFFFKSVLSWNSQHDGWDLRLRDGTLYQFLVDFVPEVVVLKAVEDRYGNRLAISRDVNRRVTQIRSPNGRTLDFTYDGSNRVTQILDNIGRTVSYQYDASGRLWKVTDARGGITEFTYDASHRMLTLKDPRAIVYLTNEYDANGRVSEQTMADGGVYTFAYTLDVNSRVVQADVTNPRNKARRVTFNATGFALTDVQALNEPEQQTTTYVRHFPSNRVTSVTDPIGRETAFGHDTLGNLTSVTRLAGTANAVTTTFTYESMFNQLASVTDPLSHTTSFTYTSAGALGTVVDPLNHQTTITSNSAGQPLTITDPLNKTTTFGYSVGNLVSIMTPLGNVETRFVDAAGRLQEIVDARGGRTRLEYNAHDQLTKIIDPLNGETTSTYDGNGNLLTLTDARSKTTAWTYDHMDRVETRTDPLSRSESFDYDLNGNLTEWTDRKGQVTTYQYDALDRKIFVGFGTTGTPPTYASTITTSYDAGDRETDIVDSVAGTIDRTFDLLDRLTQEITPEGTVSYTYDNANRRATMTVAAQTAVSYAFDNADRLTAVTRGSEIAAIAYDDSDRRTSLTLPNGIVVEYGYDDDSRLTGLTYKQGMSTLGALTYAYDANGQRTSVGGTYARTGLPAALSSATYDDANQIVTFGGATFSYDANGNVMSDGVRSYTWNARNQLASLTGPVNASFGYDGVGRRRSKTIGGTTTQFLYDELNPVQELSSGTPTANLLTGLDVDEFFTRTDSTGVRNYLTDALGSTAALADGAGSVATEFTYEAFGTTTASGASTTTAHHFTGREEDATGLYYYRARYYDSLRQRFVAEDPIGFLAGDTNLHAFVFNAPVDFTDPLGLVIASPACKPRSSAKESWGQFFARLACIQLPLPLPIASPGSLGAGFGAGFGAAAGAGAGAGGGPSRQMLESFRRQVERHGRRALERSLESMQKRLAEHLQKLADARRTGGHTSSLEREIRMFENSIEAIKRILGGG